MGLIERKQRKEARREEMPEAGELLGIEAIDKSGLVVRDDGYFLRALNVTPPNPLIMTDVERADMAEAFGQLVGRLRSKQSIQFYVEARPVLLDSVLADVRAEVERAAGPMPTRDELTGDQQALALWRLYSAMEESLRVHSDREAAVKLDCYAILSSLPETRRRLGAGEQAKRFVRLFRAGLRGQPELGQLSRPLSAHRRAARESLQHAEMVRGELEALDMPCRMLNGEQFAQLLWSRFNPTRADRIGPPPMRRAVEVFGELDTEQNHEAAKEAARRLREHVVESSFDFISSPRYATIDRDLEQTVYAASTADSTFFGWLLGAMQTRSPFALSVHVHALDKSFEKRRVRLKHRRLVGLNRGAEMRGRVPDFENLAVEDEHAQLLQEMAGAEREAIHQVSLYQAIRERGPSPDEEELENSVNWVVEQQQNAVDVRVHRGELQQKRLWRSTLPLGRDVAHRVRRYVTRNVGETVPLVGTNCGSPDGIPLGLTDPGRTVVHLNPFDIVHDNATLLVNGKSGVGKTMATNLICSRALAQGMRSYIFDRAGHYEFLSRLIPGSEHLAIGSLESPTINPWDVDDPANVSLEKITYLLALHTLLISQGSDGRTDPLERNLLDAAIRAVYIRAAEEGFDPLERHLHEELDARSKLEAKEGDINVATILASLAERLAIFCWEGSYAYLLDRETNVAADAPLVIFDTRHVPDDVLRPVIFSLIEWVTRRVERQRDAHREEMAGPNPPKFLGRSQLVIDEGWHIVQNEATGTYANDLARRSRHLGLFFVVISQQLSDFDTPQGRALIRNSSMQLFLRQHAEELDYLQDALRLSDSAVKTISRLSTEKGVASQAFFCNGLRGQGTIRIGVGPLENWSYTSEPHRDVPLRAQYLERFGGDAWTAVAALAGHLEGETGVSTRPLESEVS